MHTPVLLQEVIEALEIRKGGKYIDATFGEGGHAKAIIKQGGRVLGIERDMNQIQRSMFNVQRSEKLILIHGNFADIEEIARKNGFFPADGIVFDLGLSMRQLQEGKKGLSYKKKDEPLDMRMDEAIEKNASELVNSLSAEELYEIFSRYSEEINSRAIAHTLVRSRSVKKIQSVGDVLTLIDSAIGKSDVKVYSRIFQALRIAVNGEFDNVTKGLEGAIKITRDGGKIAVISFHSLEDRIIKQFIRGYGFKQDLISGEKGYSFERSAKLRIIHKTT